MSAVAVTGTSSVGAVALATVALSVVVDGVALEVAVAARISTMSTRGFLLGGSVSLRGLLFRLGFW